MRTIIDKESDPENGTFTLRMAFVSIGVLNWPECEQGNSILYAPRKDRKFNRRQYRAAEPASPPARERFGRGLRRVRSWRGGRPVGHASMAERSNRPAYLYTPCCGRGRTPRPPRHRFFEDAVASAAPPQKRRALGSSQGDLTWRLQSLLRVCSSFLLLWAGPPGSSSVALPDDSSLPALVARSLT